jgi:hypothetical protein
MRWLDERLARSLYRGAPYEKRPKTVFAKRADWLVANGHLNPGEKTLVVGSGFGYLLDELHSRGFIAGGLEPGPYFALRPDEWSEWAKAHTLRLPVQECADYLENLYDVVFTEDCLSMHDDDELDDFYTACERIARHKPPIHLVTTREDGTAGDSALQWKPIDEWRSTRPDHVFVAAGEVD